MAINKQKDPEQRIIEAISTSNMNTIYIDNNVSLFYTYDLDCENIECEECERKNYCGYYLNEKLNNSDDGIVEKIEEKDIVKNKKAEDTEKKPKNNKPKENQM